jgi:hypothetical protein
MTGPAGIVAIQEPVRRTPFVGTNVWKAAGVTAAAKNDACFE